MWLYVPNISTSSLSVPVEPDLISASNWQFQVLEQSAWSRGKASRSRNWYQLWKRASWLQRLYGAMPEPSTADLGAAQWMASLVASRVNLIVSREERKASLTSGIYGAQRGGLSSNLAHGLSLSKMSGECFRQGMTKSLARNVYSETFQSLVSRLREDCSRRLKSARLTSENASSSSPWPTPATRDYKGANSADHLEAGTGRKHMDQLPNFVAHVWATPCARDHMPAHSPEYIAAKKAQGHGMKILPDQVAQWATPTASENSNRTTKMAPTHGKSHGIVLAGQAADLSRQWMTPRSHEVGQYQYSRGNKTKPVATLTGQAFSHQDQPTKTDGDQSSSDRRILNPRFVEWLMGWPPMWTNFACSAMELSHWKQRMRSALSQLALFG